MDITAEERQLFLDNVEDGMTFLGASLASDNPFYMLKAINDQIKYDGLDWPYDLNAKGCVLQQLYEDLYAKNEALLRKPEKQ